MLMDDQITYLVNGTVRDQGNWDLWEQVQVRFLIQSQDQVHEQVERVCDQAR